MSGRRNFLYLVADDFRAELGVDDPALHTPNLDRLALQATRFSRAYPQATLCVPSRASFMTGLRPTTLGVLSNTPTNALHAAATRLSIVELARTAGFATAAAGKIFHIQESRGYSLPWVKDTNKLLARPCETRAALNVTQPAERSLRSISFHPIVCSLPKSSRVQFGDEKVVEAALRRLDQLRACGVAEAEVPWASNVTRRHCPRGFLLLVGFLRPHNPYQVAAPAHITRELFTLCLPAALPVIAAPPPLVTVPASLLSDAAALGGAAIRRPASGTARFGQRRRANLSGPAGVTI